MNGATLAEVDAELAHWRDRLAAASRNVSELSELPEFAAARVAAKGTGRLAEAARELATTMDELWQGVLLIGDVLQKAEQARNTGYRLWRGEEAARQAMDLLQGPSITVDLSDTPVLHRRLLSGPRATAVVPPAALLQTMNDAFDRARESLRQIAEAASRATSLQSRLAGVICGLPGVQPLAVELAAAHRADPLDRLDALESLAPRVEAAGAAAQRARAGLAKAEKLLEEFGRTAAEAIVRADACRLAVSGPLPCLPETEIRELAAWLERIGRTVAQGRAEAGIVGLASWLALKDRLAGEVSALNRAAETSLARRDELRARYGALRARQRAQAARGAIDPALEATAAAVRAALDGIPVDLAEAARVIGDYQAALARG